MKLVTGDGSPVPEDYRKKPEVGPDGVMMKHSISPSVTVTRYTTEGWLAARDKLVTGSDAAVIIGGAKWSSPLKIWGEKTGVVPKEPEDSLPEYLEIGREIETFLSQMLAKRAGIHIARTDDALATNRDLPGWGYSADGLVISGGNGPVGLIETKNVGGFMVTGEEPDGTFWDWRLAPPLKVWAQVQHGMAVCDLPRCYVGALLGGNEFVWHEVQRDPTWVERNGPTLDAFASCLSEGTMPDQDGSDADRAALKAMNPIREGAEPVGLTMAALELTEEREEICDQIKTLDARKKAIENDILARLAGAPVGVLADGRKWTHATQTRKARVVKGSTFTVLRAPRKKKTS